MAGTSEGRLLQTLVAPLAWSILVVLVSGAQLVAAWLEPGDRETHDGPPDLGGGRAQGRLLD